MQFRYTSNAIRPRAARNSPRAKRGESDDEASEESDNGIESAAFTLFRVESTCVCRYVDFKARAKQIKPSTRCRRKTHDDDDDDDDDDVLKIGFDASLVSAFVLLAIFRMNNFHFLIPKEFLLAGFDTLLLLVKRGGWHPPVCSVCSVTACCNCHGSQCHTAYHYYGMA
jgi:hypothetical protein